MARARLLKPGFFTDDVLASLPMSARLLFQGLWCVSDREGRVEDRPAKLKVEIMPYDKTNVDRLLGMLAEKGFIVRYESGDRRYIQVVNFSKHQTPHMKEPASTIPAPDLHRTDTVPAQRYTESLTLNPIPVAVAVAETEEGVGETSETAPPKRLPPAAPIKVAPPAERLTAVFEDDGFMASLRAKSPEVDIDWERTKMARYVEDKPPKSNYKNFVSNWIERASRNGVTNAKPERHTAKATGDALADRWDAYARGDDMR